jgi:hypothetical protein
MRTAALPAHGTQPFGASILGPMPASPRYPSLTPTTAQLALTLVAGRRRSFRKRRAGICRTAEPPASCGRPQTASSIRRTRDPRQPLSKPGLSGLVDRPGPHGRPRRRHPLGDDGCLDLPGSASFPAPHPAHAAVLQASRSDVRILSDAAHATRAPRGRGTCERREGSAALRGRPSAARDRPRAGGRGFPRRRPWAPPPGVGRFISLLASRGLELLPAGVFEDDGALCVHIGAPIAGSAVAEGAPEARDRQSADRVMQAIASCLPERLRGSYSRGGAVHARP